MTDNGSLPNKTVSVYQEDPYKVTTQQLGDGNTLLSCFFFHSGANFYVFTYEKAGETHHTFVDTGDAMYRDRIWAILRTHNIDPGRIENIIITHRHHDHCGLADVLAGESETKLLVHASFREFVYQSPSEIDRGWLRGFDPIQLQRCHVTYLSPSNKHRPVRIQNAVFPCLEDNLPIGKTGHLEILACPESATMHTPDQLIVRYIPDKSVDGSVTDPFQSRPGDIILFSGDLWLMHGPLFTSSYRKLTRNIRMAYDQMKGAIRGKRPPRRDPRLQDTEAKEALKRGFSLIQVMPGHGEDFLGTRMIPECFLADRDLLVELGYSMFEKKSVLRSDNLADKVAAIRKRAYATFISEIGQWQGFGYTIGEISDFLVRIYTEQTGGGPLVREDREERRQKIEETLKRLKQAAPDNSLGALAESTLLKLDGIS